MTMVLAVDMSGLDPIQFQGVQNWGEAMMVPAVYDALFYLDLEGGLHPKIARSLASEDSGKTWTLTLREGVRFSDGTALDAEAVRFNWARLADPANRAVAAKTAGMIQAMEVTGPLTLRVTLHEPAARWNLRVARNLSFIGSPTAIAAAGEGFSTAPVGAGPFLLADWTPGSHMRFVRNPDYWQAGKPYLDEVVVLTRMPEASAKLEAMMSGRAQGSIQPLGPQLGPYRDDPDRFELLGMQEPGGGIALALNHEAAPFNDIRVRRAVALGLSSAEYVELCQLGDPAMAMTSIDRPGSTYAAPDICLPTQDIAQAQALIDEVVAETGAPIRFTVDTFTNEGHIREANAVKIILERHLRDIEVTVEAHQAPELLGKYRSGDYQSGNYQLFWSDPTLDLPAAFTSTSPQNIMRYKSAAADAALERLAGLSDQGELIAAHHEVLRHVLDDVGLIWLCYKKSFHAIDKRRVGAWPLFYSLRPMIEDAWMRA
jgi:peptide/nickel transport system substrate-binding protein